MTHTLAESKRLLPRIATEPKIVWHGKFLDGTLSIIRERDTIIPTKSDVSFVIFANGVEFVGTDTVCCCPSCIDSFVTRVITKYHQYVLDKRITNGDKLN